MHTQPFGDHMYYKTYQIIYILWPTNYTLENLSKHISKEEKIHHIIFGKNNEDNSNWQQAGNNPRTITLLLTRKELPLRIKQKYMPNTFNLKKKKFHMTWEHYYCVKIFIYTLKLLHSDTCNITIFSIQTHGSMAEKLSFSRLYSNTSSWTSDDQMF